MKPSEKTPLQEKTRPPFKDPDPEETKEWLEAFGELYKREGKEKAKYLVERLADQAATLGVSAPIDSTTPYANTLTPRESEKMPDTKLAARNVAAYVRWNAIAMVLRANRDFPGIGGHLASYSSCAVLYEVGFDFFFQGPYGCGGEIPPDTGSGLKPAPVNSPSDSNPWQGDLIFFQGHSSPGIYARAFIEGRLTEADLLRFRRETESSATDRGLSSYPHPWLMSDFWQFPTVSMGLGPIMAIYQARFMKYMDMRGLKKAGKRKVWAFLGDGETDEPESRGAISLAAREKLDNLIFVINCNLQRLDGPVRGNGKIIQELEGVFRGAGWNVIKVIWGSEWDPILERDTEGILLEKFNQMVDGEFQNLRSKDGAYIRKKLFDPDPRLRELIKGFSDSEIWQMTRGGHDPRKVYAAYAAALAHTQGPTVILLKTIKGFGMGKSGESANIAHNVKKMDLESLKEFRDRFHVPLADDELEKLPFLRPPEESAEYRFIHEQREALGGYLPARDPDLTPLQLPSLETFESLLKGSGKAAMSTTMAFVRYLSALTKDKKIGKKVVPIVSDEARTFGMEGLFRQLGIYSPEGQLYEPEDAELMAWYREDRAGAILEEGITESGAVSSWIAAGTSYANYGVMMIPFFIFYSMFGFQRTGDLLWAGADMRTRGFLLGATSGRTTLNGEGLQHQDGQSHLLASTIPNCLSYDPAFSFELVIILQEGLKRMYQNNEDIFYYITLYNENYPMPSFEEILSGRPREEIIEGITRGIYLYRKSSAQGVSVTLMGSGSIFLEVLRAAETLEKEYGLSCNIYSVPGVNELYREASECERHNRYHPEKAAKVPYITGTLKEAKGPVIFAGDFVKSGPERLGKYINSSFTVLGTDGFGKSDTRESLRDYFENSAGHIVITTLEALYLEGEIEKKLYQNALKKYQNPDLRNSQPRQFY